MSKVTDLINNSFNRAKTWVLDNCPSSLKEVTVTSILAVCGVIYLLTFGYLLVR